MLDKITDGAASDLATAVDNWLTQFENALAKPNDGVLKTLFHPDRPVLRSIPTAPRPGW
jgi:hypothetical protein